MLRSDRGVSPEALSLHRGEAGAVRGGGGGRGLQVQGGAGRGPGRDL